VNEALPKALPTFAQMHRELRGDKGSRLKLKTNVKRYEYVFDYIPARQTVGYMNGETEYSTEKTSKEYS